MGEQRNWHHHLGGFEEARESLAKLQFPPLKRPNVPDTAPTRALVDWAIRVYCFSLLSHYREMLDSLLVLLENGKIPAGFVVARCLLELGAHAHYVHKHVAQYLSEDGLGAAWEFLTEITMGSRYMREEIAEQDDSQDLLVPEPREIAKVLRCFNEYGSTKQADKSWSFLSEYSHPSMSAFSHYWEPVDEHTTEMRFIEPPRDPSKLPRGNVFVSLIAALQFTFELLGMTGETELASQIKSVLMGLVKSDSPPLAAP